MIVLSEVVHLEGLFVDIRVIPHISFPSFAEEYEISKEKDVTLTFFLPEGQKECVLTNQLSLFLQIHLYSQNHFYIKILYQISYLLEFLRSPKLGQVKMHVKLIYTKAFL